MLKAVLIIISSILGLAAFTLTALKLIFAAAILWKVIILLAISGYLLKLIYIRL